jgi:acetyl-CoA synthetase
MEGIVWEPTDDYIENANITRFMKKNNIKDYDQLIKKSTEDIEWFWEEAVKDLNIEWYKPYEKVIDDSKGIQWVKWFVGGKINIVHNCVDKHAKSDRKNNIAIIWENESGESKKITYEELFWETNKFANALKELGVKKGDRVGIYMPMVPEIVFAFLGAIKIGAIGIPIFSGFGGHALAQRLDIAGAKILITADGSVRRGKTFEIKKEVDKGVESVKTLEHVLVFKRLDIEIPWKEERDMFVSQKSSSYVIFFDSPLSFSQIIAILF